MRFATAFSFASALFLSACGSSDSATQPGTGVLTSLGISAPGNALTINGTMQLAASPRDQNGNAFPTTVLWTSSSNFVALVTPLGFVSAVAGGQAYMIATGGGLKDSTLLTVVTGAFPSSASVVMLPSAYSPPQTDVALGATVQFVFPSLAHNVFFNASPAGAPADIPGEVSNQTVSRVFTARGSFVYNCTIHPGMTGTIVVH